jgi:peroxiredoxin
MIMILRFSIKLTILILIVSCTQPVDQKGDRGYHAKIGDTVGDINFTLTDNTTINLNQLKGKVIVLQFTASWCSVCRKEMPFLEEEVWQKYKNDDFILIGVDYNEPIEKVIAFKQKMKTTYPMAIDPDGSIFLKFSYKGSGVTRNVIINKDGKIAYLTRLFDRDEFDEMKEKIAELMK